MIGDLGARAPAAMSRLEAGFEEAMAIIRIFPNDDSAVRSIGAVFMEIGEA